MSRCNGCGGVVGRDCFNPQECEWITQQMNNDVAADYDALKAHVCQLEEQLTQQTNETLEAYNRECKRVDELTEEVAKKQERIRELESDYKKLTDASILFAEDRQKHIAELEGLLKLPRQRFRI